MCIHYCIHHETQFFLSKTVKLVSTQKLETILTLFLYFTKRLCNINRPG